MKDNFGTHSNYYPRFWEDAHQVLTLVVSSGIAAGAYNILKAWLDQRNEKTKAWASLQSTQRLKLKVGDVEVEATQMPTADVLHLLELLQQNAEEKQIRDLLLKSSPPIITPPK